MVELHTVFTRGYITREGLPPRMYRHPDEIAKDITSIKERIGDVYDRLNIRSVLAEAIDALAEESPEVWIPSLYELCDEADSLLDRMKSLMRELDELKKELEETRCALMT